MTKSDYKAMGAVWDAAKKCESQYWLEIIKYR